VGALHVLAIALFGVAVLIPHIRGLGFAVRGPRVSNPATAPQWIRRVGLTLVLVTGALVFASGAARYYGSTSFRIKMILLALIALNAIVSRRNHRKLNSAIALVLWAAVIFASRGIAFF